MNNEFTTETRTPATEAVTPPPTAVPAVPVPPEAEDYETWPDDALMQRSRTRLIQSDRHDQKRIMLGRQTIEERLEAGHQLSVVHGRHVDDGIWCALLKQYGVARTTAWEVIAAHERSAAAGHTKQEVAANHETWTEVLIAYGVVKERPKKQDMPAADDAAEEVENGQGPVHAEPADQVEAGQEGSEPEAAPAPAILDQPEPDDNIEAEPGAPAVPHAKKADKAEDKAVQALLEKPGAVAITEGESVAFRKFVEAVGNLARAEIVFTEMKRRAAHA